MEKKYKLKVTEQFEEELYGIASYIKDDLQNPIASVNLIDEITKAVNKRLQYPIGFKKYSSKNSIDEIYYKIQVKNFTVFYVVIEDVMECRRVIYSRRDLKNLF